MLSNGEKFNPVPTETALQQHASLAGALIVGQGRRQPALLVEPRSDLRDSSIDVLGDIWPLVDMANSNPPGHGRITKSLMLMTAAEKPFVRAGKGTVVRKLTEEVYRTELDDLYENAAPVSAMARIILSAPVYDAESVYGFVRPALTQVLPGFELKDDENFYDFGLDSLKTIETVQILNNSLKAHRPESELSWISNDVLYRFSTIKKLSHVFLTFLNERKTPGPALREAEMSAMLEKLSSGLSGSIQAKSADPDRSGLCIALTGFTGWLGQHVLGCLLNESNVRHVYCLSRSANAHQEWNDWHKQKFEVKPFPAKLSFLTVLYDQEG